ncbi:MAG: glycosyltransferase family 4 protein [Myxococcota bacterium]
MRVAIVIERFARGPGGAELDALRTAQELAKLGHEVTVVCRSVELDAPPGVHLRRVRVPRIWQPLRVRLFSERAARATAHGFDLVHSFARTRRQQIYRSGGGSHAEYMERVYRQPRLQRALSPRHRAILGVEEAVFADPSQIIHCIAKRGAEEIAQRYAVPRERLVVIYNGVDTARFHPERRAMHRQRLRSRLRLEGPVALFVGGGLHRKGLDRAIRGLANARTSAQLLVVGGGRKEPARRLAVELGVAERVHFLGHRHDVETWHAAADLLVLPTRYDPFGNAVLEGMASGLPVATTREAGASELIEDGKNGFLLDDDFTPAFERLASPAALEPVAVAARRTAERFTWARHAERLIELYERVRS